MREGVLQPDWQVAECLVPGLTAAAAQGLAERVRAELDRAPRPDVAFVGSLLMAEDEVLLCLFTGQQADVQAVSERAGLPFDRVVPCVALGWRAGDPDDHA